MHVRKTTLRFMGTGLLFGCVAAGAQPPPTEAVFVNNGAYIDEYSLNGQFIGAFTAPPQAPGSSFSPQGLALGADGKLYAADLLAHDLAVFDPQTGNFLGRVGSVVPADSSVSIHGLAVTPSGNLAGLANGNQLFTVNPVTNTTTITDVNTVDSTCCATFLAVSASGQIVASNSSNSAIYDLTSNQLVANLQPNVDGVAFGPSGDIFAVNGDTIARVDSAGNVTTFLTDPLIAHGGGAGDLAFDDAGDLWVTSPSKDLILEYDGSGNLLRSFCAGSGGTAACGSAGFNFIAIGALSPSTTPVPVPATLPLLGLGLASLGFVRNLKKS